MPLKSISGTVYKRDTAASNTLASTDDANANANNNQRNKHDVYTDVFIDNTLLCNAKGSSGGDTNKKGEPFDVAGCKAESLGKEDEDGIAFTLISQEKEVGYISEHCLS